MTVETTYSPAQFTGNDVTTAFSYTFICFDEDDLEVYLTDTGTSVDTLQVLNTDYTVVLDSDFIGGTITFVTAPTSTDRVTISRSQPLEQKQDYRVAGNFPSESTERQLDKMVLMIQQLNDADSRSVQVPVTTAPGTSLALPTPDAGKVLQWNATEDALINSTLDLIDINAAANAALQAEAGDAIDAYLAANPLTYDLIQDTTPQLGGDMDVNGNDIVSVSNGDINITPNGTGTTTITNLKYADEVDGNNKGVKAAFRSYLTTTATAFQITLVRAGQVFLWQGTSAGVATIPTNASQAFVIGTEIEIFNDGTANLQVVGDTGVVVNGVTAGSVTFTPSKGGLFRKVGTDRWIFSGDLTAAASNSNFTQSLYSGTGASQSIGTGQDFAGDNGFIWAKNLDTVSSHPVLDTTRGTSALIWTDAATAENTSTARIASFDSDGVTLNTDSEFNTSGDDYVLFGWLEATGFMKILTYVGDGTSARNIAHGLGGTPSMVIIKNRTLADPWTVQHINLTSGLYHLRLSSDAAEVNSSGAIFNGAADATNIKIGSDNTVNASGSNFVAYILGPVAGSSNFGSYTGTGATGKQLTGFGFQPKAVLIKRRDAAGDWVFQFSDTESVNPNLTAVKSTTNITLDTDGFTVNETGADLNTSGGKYVYAAWG